MCLLLLLKFCLGRELTLIIAPRAADRPIPASAGLRGTSGRGIKKRRNSASRCKSKTYRVYQCATLRRGHGGPRVRRPTRDTPRGAMGRSAQVARRGGPVQSCRRGPACFGRSALQLPPSLILFIFIIFIIVIFLRPLRRSSGTHGPLSPSSSRPARFFRGDKSANRARRCCGGTACPAERSALRLSGFWRAARRGRQHLALLREPSPAVDRRISGREPRRSRRSPPSRAPPGRGDPRHLRGSGSERAAKAPYGRSPGPGSPRGAIPRGGGGGTGLAAPPAHRQLREHRVQSHRAVDRGGASAPIRSLPSDTWAPVVAPRCGRGPTPGPATAAAALNVGPGRGSAGRGRAVGGEEKPRSPRRTG